MQKHGVLVVDDSAFMRRAVSQIIESDPQLFVAGIARNGLEAVEKVQRLEPDLVTMDIEMPEMNGLQALEEIMKIHPVPVFMLSSHTGEGAKETLKALELGAVDFYLKENLIKNKQNNDQIHDFLTRLKGIAGVKFSGAVPDVVTDLKRNIKKEKNRFDLVFIGCSTGGPSALQSILPHFPKDFPLPVVVAQHMPPGFTKPLAERFDALCQLKVKEAQAGESVKPGTIYIAPSGFQTWFEKKMDGTIIFMVDSKENDQSLYKPSIDITLESAAPIFNKRLLSVILTGMGVDGRQGCGFVKKHQGSVLVEAEESCTVYGMPKAVLEAGFADDQFLLSRMFQEIMALV